MILHAIPGWPKYAVTRFGDVYKFSKERGWWKMSPKTNRDGYKELSFTVDHHEIWFGVHRLVYLTWVGPIPEGMEVNHKDSMRGHNHWRNLNLVTHKQNMEHCINQGRMWYQTGYLHSKLR